MKIPIFPGKYYQNGGFSMAMLVSGRVLILLRVVSETCSSKINSEPLAFLRENVVAKHAPA